MTAIWYVHGFGASDHSFTWLQHQFSHHETHYFSYTVDESVESCIRRLTQHIQHAADPVILIGHSLGGVIARVCASRCTNVVRLVTLCAPFGGLQHANFLSLISNVSAFKELRNYSSLLTEMRATTILGPHLAIVASNGLPLMPKPNDGVLTMTSQTALPNLRYIDFALNHFEVLLSPEVAATIQVFLDEPLIR
jgi:pimeloyl-ACP methyl ester carboxylesterase